MTSYRQNSTNSSDIFLQWGFYHITETLRNVQTAECCFRPDRNKDSVSSGDLMLFHAFLKLYIPRFLSLTFEIDFWSLSNTEETLTIAVKP